MLFDTIVRISALAMALHCAGTAGDGSCVRMVTRNAEGCRCRFDTRLAEGLRTELVKLYATLPADSSHEIPSEVAVTSLDQAQLLHQLHNQGGPQVWRMWHMSRVPLKKARHISSSATRSLDIDSGLGGDVLSWLNVTIPEACPANPHCDPHAKYRTTNGSCNNMAKPLLGTANSGFVRLLRPDYADGVHDPRRSVGGKKLPNARAISLLLFQERNSDDKRRTLAVMLWGQFIAHDTSLSAFHLVDEDGAAILCCSPNGSLVSERGDSDDCYAIPVPQHDDFFPRHGIHCFNMIRTLTAPSHDCKLGAAEKMNAVTHFLDLSHVYASEDSQAHRLREHAGGRLKARRGHHGRVFLPNVGDATAVCDVSSLTDTCYMAGDFRVNQNIHIAALHVIFLREHNRVAGLLAALNPTWKDERLYQESRRILIAQYQHITYSEYLPLIIGEHYLDVLQLRPETSDYNFGYDATLNPSTINSFNTAAFRGFHSTIQGRLSLLDSEFCPLHDVRFSDGFFKPGPIEQRGFLDHVLRGMVRQPSESMDKFFTHEITWHLFRTKKSAGLDLVTFDIERGRDHGLPGYNKYRFLCNLPRATSFLDFADVMSLEDIEKLHQIYEHPDDVDLYVGGLLEHLLPGTLLGPTFLCLLGEQFHRWKFGDRFYYEVGGVPHSFTPAQLAEIRKTSLSRLLCDNADNITRVPVNSFRVASDTNSLVPCSSLRIPSMDLSAWKENSTTE